MWLLRECFYTSSKYKTGLDTTWFVALLPPQRTIFSPYMAPSNLAWCAKILANFWVVPGHVDGMKGDVMVWDCCLPASLRQVWVTMVGISSTPRTHTIFHCNWLPLRFGLLCWKWKQCWPIYMSGSSTRWWHKMAVMVLWEWCESGPIPIPYQASHRPGQQWLALLQIQLTIFPPA